MNNPVQQAILERLAACLELSEDIRVGQLVAFLPVLLPGDKTPNLSDVEDPELLEALDQLHSNLSSRSASITDAATRSGS